MGVDETEIDAAVAAGALKPTDALALRRFVAARRAAPPPIASDAHFRYLGGAGGIVAALGILPVWLGLMLITFTLMGPLGGAPIAIGAWMLAGRFADARQGVAATLLYVVFGIHTAMAMLGLLGVIEAVTPLQGLLVASATSAGSFAYWYRFRLPIAFTGGVLATLTIGDHVLMGVFPDASGALVTAWMLTSALTVFACAMWWDMTDVYRQTIRSDIAWWLHGLAAFKLCASGTRAIVGVRGDADGWASLWSLPAEMATASSCGLILLIAAYAVVAIAIDRRALAVIGALFLFPALNGLTGSSLMPVTLLATGGIAIFASLRWRALRQAVLARLPATWRAQLPRTDATFLWERPVA